MQGVAESRTSLSEVVVSLDTSRSPNCAGKRAHAHGLHPFQDLGETRSRIPNSGRWSVVAVASRCTVST